MSSVLQGWHPLLPPPDQVAAWPIAQTSRSKDSPGVCCQLQMGSLCGPPSVLSPGSQEGQPLRAASPRIPSAGPGISPATASSPGRGCASFGAPACAAQRLPSPPPLLRPASGSDLCAPFSLLAVSLLLHPRGAGSLWFAVGLGVDSLCLRGPVQLESLSSSARCTHVQWSRTRLWRQCGPVR